ncbi:MAG TPA: uracil-DNA glycosylase family protein, partial [Ignavibacteriaceae bacterium]|nr:uracil-DNA glycosylase family protein [Ignavibacteriaceae bacterium]
YLNLNLNPRFKTNPPEKIRIFNPYEKEEVKRIVKNFYKKFFNDSNKRIFIFGINPGRFGGGLTGISFTDPVALKEYCGIENNLGSKKELSSKFIYNVIMEYGGAKKFFSNFYLTALFPLPILLNDKNYNYYDNAELLKKLKPYLEDSFRQQVLFGADRNSAFSLGNRNYKFLKEINERHNYFKEIKVLHHPRYIMQYKQKQVKKYVEEYLNNFQK